MLDILQILSTNDVLVQNNLTPETFCTSTKGIWQLVGYIVNIIKIAIPIIIVLLGTIDLGKAVIAGDEKQINEARGTFIKRLIYGVAVFFVVTIVQLIFGLIADSGVNDATATNSSKVCFQCVAKPSNCK